MAIFAIAMKILGRNDISIGDVYDNFTHDTTTYIITMASTLDKLDVKNFVMRSTGFNLYP
jgi:hypothetical protein